MFMFQDKHRAAVDFDFPLPFYRRPVLIQQRASPALPVHCLAS